MPLEIKEDHGVFEVLGDVTAKNVGALRAYFESVLESQEQVIVRLGVKMIRSWRPLRPPRPTIF